MCQFASAYPLETLRKLHEVEAQMQQPSVGLVQQLTKQLNEIVQQPVAQIQSISETLHNGIHIDLSEVEALFKQSVVTRTNWASHVILRNSRLPLGERYWYITQAVLNGWSRNVLKVVAQYAHSGYDQAIGVGDYQLSKAIPEQLKSALPSIEEVEEELNRIIGEELLELIA